MTVKELIAELLKYPPDAEVVSHRGRFNGSGEGYCPVVQVATDGIGKVYVA